MSLALTDIRKVVLAPIANLLVGKVGGGATILLSGIVWTFGFQTLVFLITNVRRGDESVMIPAIVQALLGLLCCYWCSSYSKRLDQRWHLRLAVTVIAFLSMLEVFVGLVMAGYIE